MQDFRSLKVWQKAHRLVTEIYGITHQLRKAGISIGANVEEGCGREGERDFGRFLRIALGSANEVQDFLLLARDLQFPPSSTFKELEDLVIEVRRMLVALVAKLKDQG